MAGEIKQVGRARLAGESGQRSLWVFGHKISSVAKAVHRTNGKNLRRKLLEIISHRNLSTVQPIYYLISTTFYLVRSV